MLTYIICRPNTAVGHSRPRTMHYGLGIRDWELGNGDWGMGIVTSSLRD